MLSYRLSFIALFAMCAGAVTAQGVPQDRYVCNLGNNERVIEVIYASPPSKVPCEVSYTKSEGVQKLWRAQNEIGYCESHARTFAEKHMGWGWHCSQPAAAEVEGEDRAKEPQQ